MSQTKTSPLPDGLGTMAIYFQGLLSIKSLDPLITCSYKIIRGFFP